MASPIANTYESGPPGTELSSSKTPSPTKVATVTKNAGTTCQFSTTRFMHGTQSVRLQSATGNAGYEVYNFSPTTTTTRVSLRRYLYIESGGGSNIPFGAQLIIGRSASASLFTISHGDNAGQLLVYSAAGGQIAIGNGAIPLDTWVRIEVDFAIGTTTSNGQLTVTTYLGDSTTPIATVINSTAVNLGTAPMTNIRLGWVGWSGGYTITMYADDFYMEERASGSIGPTPVYTGEMTPELVASYGSTAAGISTGAVSLTDNIDVGDLILVSATFNSTGITATVTDSKGHTYTTVGSESQSGVGITTILLYAIATTAMDTSDTVTLVRSSSGTIAMTVVRVPNVDTENPIGTFQSATGNNDNPDSGALAPPTDGLTYVTVGTTPQTTVTAGPSFGYEKINAVSSSVSSNTRQNFAAWTWYGPEADAWLGIGQAWVIGAITINPRLGIPTYKGSSPVESIYKGSVSIYELYKGTYH